MISVLINGDTRPGCNSDVNTTGDYGRGSLNGVRSFDFLTEGVRNKRQFFAGHHLEVVLYCDEHEPLPDIVREEITDLMKQGVINQFVCKPHDRSHQRWNEILYLENLKLAQGDYIAHFDGDCAAFRNPNFDIGIYYLQLLGVGFKFVCQPTTMALADHGMWWASTRFFICRRDTLDFDLIERCILDEQYRFDRYGHCPTLEHVLGRMAGSTGVLYPPANWDDYLVFSWARYHRGTLKKLDAMPYEQVRDYILGCGILGPNDVVSVPI